MKTITSIVKAYNSESVSKFNDIMTREEKKLVKAFVNLACDICKILESIREDESLKDYREEYNKALVETGLKGSNYGFSNILKIGKLSSLGKNSWLLSFPNLTSLAIGLAGFESVPACKGIAALEIKTVDKNKTIEQTIESLPTNISSAELREKVNSLKGLPVKPKKAESAEIDTDVKAVAREQITNAVDDCKPVSNETEKVALQLAKVIASYRNDEAFLLAFCVQLQNLKVINTLKACIDEAVKNNKRVDLSIS